MSVVLVYLIWAEKVLESCTLSFQVLAMDLGAA